MNMPGFTANVSLYRARGQYQGRAAGVNSRADNRVVPQTRAEAENVIRTLGIGTVHCATQRVCLGGHDVYTGDGRTMWSCDGWTTIDVEPCYWWPW
jgi:hypothetical protein